ncbi:ATP phosphoribosyltransferase regulatory subunit [Umboniibacter marinipuniceus]|uniref:ATP phosphoribosyltransferase regulatory subunit n=1 Tax=Umboniibacter marinipuniceus TaxID=569599 RepID=A0A3M0AAV0_9GAMM|nr:ATP phosphoribosyltransferase regulatory subunit [Umboniibacter marinipuniceus]RMA82271.1 ATP phosphoribosyltransferase regulatory subunit [Umboniibacter marinipuniceus]
MSSVNRWLLPEGIEELLPETARRVEFLRRHLLNLYTSWGYQLVIPPLVEFTESLLLDQNSDLDLKTLKVMDRISGKMMGLRADITAQIARIDAHAMRNEGANRLCYAGSVVHTTPSAPLASRSPIQIGCELYGESSVSGDVEVMSLMLQTLSTIGVADLTLDLGHISILEELQLAAELSATDRDALAAALKTKSMAQFDAVLAQLTIDTKIQQQLRAVATIQGGSDALRQLDELLRGTSANLDIALDELQVSFQTIAKRFPSVAVFIDLTEMRGFDYHTGLVFSALSSSSGKPLANGGRYNNISHQFGRDRAATGFNCDLKALSLVATVEPPEMLAPIYVASSDVEALWQEIEVRRQNGETVVEGNAPEGGRQLIYRDQRAALINL